jgi:hydroxymethylbilane synthase
MKLLIGSRGSKLALTQTEMVAAEIRAANPGLETEIKIIKTKGDLIQDKPLNEIGDKGLFVREIEEALLSGKIDLAVHSLKDMPGEQPPGLEMAITPKREDPRDVIISFCGAKKIADLPQGSTIATGSLRRICQLQDLRSDIVTAPIRGNVDTRIRKAHENGYQGIVLAAAGLHRLGISYEGFPLEVTEMLPAPAQGILGLETRIGDKKTLALLAPLHDAASHRQAQAERAFLRYIEGGCHAPMGAFCEISGDSFTLTGFYETERALYKEEISGKSGEEAAAGKALALRLKEKIEAENR